MRPSHLFRSLINRLYRFSEDFLESDFYQTLINPPEFTSEDRERFIKFSHDEFIYVIMSWAVSIILIVLATVPLDLWIYQYSSSIFWRVMGIKATGIIGLSTLCLVINYFELEDLWVDRVCASLVTVLLSFLAYVLSYGGGIDSVWFHPLYVFPVVILLGFRFSLRERFVWLIAGVIGMALAYFGPHPEYFYSDSILVIPILLVFTSFYYLMGSQLVSNLYRSSFRKNMELEEERERSEQLLLNIFPEPVADRLKQSNQTIADGYEEATVMFADIVNFTPLANRLPAPDVVSILDEIFSSFDDLIDRYEVEKIKTIGDEYFVVAGIPKPNSDHAITMAQLAYDLQSEVRNYTRDNGEPFQLRIGLNTGSLVAGTIGKKKYVYDVWGETVNVGSRMESYGVPGSIQVTTATKQAIEEQDQKDQFQFERRGEIDVKGSGSMETFFLRKNE